MTRNIYYWLANFVFFLHFLFAAFVLIGWWFEAARFAYYAAMVSWIFSWFVLGSCPLSKWEFMLRRQYDKDIDVNQEMIQYLSKKHFDIDVSHERVLFTGGLVWVILLGLSLFVPH